MVFQLQPALLCVTVLGNKMKCYKIIMDIRKLANPVCGLALKMGWDVLAAPVQGFCWEWPGLA